MSSKKAGVVERDGEAAEVVGVQGFSGVGYTAENDGEHLTIVIDLNNDGGISSSGKSQIIATSGGNIDAGDDGVKLGLNVYRKVMGSKVSV
jgi:hypothetical protein